MSTGKREETGIKGKNYFFIDYLRACVFDKTLAFQAVCHAGMSLNVPLPILLSLALHKMVCC